MLRTHPLFSTSLVSLGWQDVLRQSSPRVGILLECGRSIRDQIAQQAEAFNATRHAPRVFTLRMEETEHDFDGTMRRLFSFLRASHALWPGGTATRGQLRAGSSLAMTAAIRNDVDLDSVDALVTAAAKFDLSRNRRQLDDGHLSSLQRKRQLRGLLLNDTRLAAELAGWRAATGYTRDYRTHCRQYGLAYFDEAVADGFADGASYGRRRRRRRTRQRQR